jgi:TonB family protein
MSVEEKKNCAEEIGTLSSCLIEADPEQKARERKIKRRALAISITLQSAVIVALVLVPLLGRTEKLPYTLFTPIPQYYHSSHERVVEARPTGPVQHRECVVCFNGNLSPHPATQSTVRQEPGQIGDPNIGVNVGPGSPDGLNIFDPRRGPTPPADTDRDQKKRIKVGGAVQQAMLTHRVEPSYPPLARQLRVSGQVHLRAIISTDGSIDSLQVMDGHPLLVQSALDAVRQWHYQPTKLNGQPVEVETIITVVYTLNQ